LGEPAFLPSQARFGEKYSANRAFGDQFGISSPNRSRRNHNSMKFERCCQFYDQQFRKTPRPRKMRRG
jgi:hypothetical protein